VHTYREVIPWYWGVFRWLSYTYPRLIHRILNWFTVIAILGLVMWGIKIIKKRKTNIRTTNVIFLSYAVSMYFVCLTTFDYLFNSGYHYSFGIQGRYFFPVIIGHMGLLIIGVIQLLPKKIHEVFLKITGVFFIAFHLYAQYLVTTSYFNILPIKAFFNQASQYKPDFFKSPILEILVVSYILLIILFVKSYLGIKLTYHEKD
jgi:hypothetical protein